VAGVRTAVVALIGTSCIVWGTRTARRAAVAGRLLARAGIPERLRVPAPIERRVAAALDAAALDVSPVRAIEYWLIGIAAAAVVGAGFGDLVAAPAGAIAAGIGAPIALLCARGRRARMIEGAVPITIERVASELRAGGTIATGVNGIARGDSVLAADFARIDARLQLGAPMVAALRAWTGERDAWGVDVAAGALAMCTTVGGRAADALDSVAASLRDRGAVAAEARALSSQARLSAFVVGGTPLLYLAWSALIDRSSLDTLLGTPTGRVCVLVGLGLEVVGGLWMRRIIRAGSFL
jgi:tight adherence protein B